jgi:hypothetical protein
LSKQVFLFELTKTNFDALPLSANKIVWQVLN